MSSLRVMQHKYGTGIAIKDLKFQPVPKQIVISLISKYPYGCFNHIDKLAVINFMNKFMPSLHISYNSATFQAFKSTT